MKTLMRLSLLIICFFYTLQNELSAENFSFNCSTDTPQIEQLIGYIEANKAHPRNCNKYDSDLWFAIRIEDLKKENQEIIKAVLKINVEAISTDFSYSDTMLLTFIENDRKTMSWDSTIGTHGPMPGILDYKWEFGKNETITLKLHELPCMEGEHEKLLTHLNYYGYLDIIVQDDTAVNSIDLSLTYSPINYSLKLGEAENIDEKTVIFPIEIINPDNKEITSIDGSLAFNSSIIQNSDNPFVLESSMLDLLYDSFYNSSNNTFTIYATNESFDGSGTVAKIKFNISGNDGEQTDISFVNPLINRLDVQSQGLTFEVPIYGPIISDITPDPIILMEDTSIAASFTCYDQQTPPSELLFSKISNNENLIPSNDDDHISTSNVDTNFTLKVTPPSDQYGEATIEIMVIDSDNLTDSTMVKVIVLPINDPPDFGFNASIETYEDSGDNHFDNYITSIHPGINETDQTILKKSIKSVSKPELFSSVPQLVDNQLIYSVSPDAFGSTDLEICVQDDGGTSNSGDVDTRCKIGTLTIIPVNDRPAFEMLSDHISLEPGITTYTKEQFIVNVKTGPDNESQQQIQQYFVSQPNHPELFRISPSIINGSLMFELNPNVVGKDSFSIEIKDNGGTENNGIDISFSKTLTIEAKGYSIKGQVIYYSSDIPVPDVTVILTGTNGSYVAHTDSNGDYQFDNLTKDHYSLKFSKATDQGGVQALDATLMGRIIVGLEELNCYTRIASDLYRDNFFTGMNAAKIARHSVGLNSCLTLDCNHWAFAPDNAQCSHVNEIPYPYSLSFDLEENKTLTTRAVRIGDTTGNWKPQANTLDAASKSKSISEMTIEVNQYDTLSLPVYLSLHTVIKGVDIRVDHDSESAKFKEIEKINGLNDYKHVINSTNNDNTRIAIYSLNTDYYTGNQNLANVNFVILGKPGTTTTISLSTFDVNELPANGGFYMNTQAVQTIHVHINEKPAFEWYLISLCKIPENSDISVLFPEAKAAYKYKDGCYVPAKTIKPGLGYWVLLPNGFDIKTLSDISGNAFSGYIYRLPPGLHLLGSIDADAAIAGIIPDTLEFIMSTCTSASTCEEVTTVNRNQGVWVEIPDHCEFQLKPEE